MRQSSFKILLKDELTYADRRNHLEPFLNLSTILMKVNLYPDELIIGPVQVQPLEAAEITWEVDPDYEDFHPTVKIMLDTDQKELAKAIRAAEDVGFLRWFGDLTNEDGTLITRDEVGSAIRLAEDGTLCIPADIRTDAQVIDSRWKAIDDLGEFVRPFVAYVGIYFELHEVAEGINLLGCHMIGIQKISDIIA